MGSKHWMSAAATCAWLAVATGCTPATTGNQPRGAAGAAGNAVQQGGQGLGNAAQRGLNAAGAGVQRGANAVGNATGLNRLGDTARNGLNRAGTDVNNTLGPGGTLVQPGMNRWGMASLPAISINNNTRTVAVIFRNMGAMNGTWRIGGPTLAGGQRGLMLTIPTGWTVSVRTTNALNRPVAVGLSPYAAATTPMTGTTMQTLTITTPGRYRIVAITPGRMRDILGIVTASPNASGVSFAFT